MNWTEAWFRFDLIMRWIGLGIAALALLIIIVVVIKVCIEYAYKSRSKKYIWDPTKRKYVKKEDFDK